MMFLQKADDNNDIRNKVKSFNIQKKYKYISIIHKSSQLLRGSKNDSGETDNTLFCPLWLWVCNLYFILFFPKNYTFLKVHSG